MASWADAFVQSTCALDDDPVLMGYSMGGRLALHALIASPEAWKAAIIVSAHPGLGSEDERDRRRELDAEWAARARTLPWNEFLEKWNAQPVFGGTAPPPGAALAEARREAIARGFESWSLGEQGDLGRELPGISCPVLWVAGERDTRFSALADSAVSRLPRGRKWIVADAGHRVPWEKPAEFRAKVLAFLEECGIE